MNAERIIQALFGVLVLVAVFITILAAFSTISVGLAVVLTAVDIACLIVMFVLVLRESL